jgi:hypothetical protein
LNEDFTLLKYIKKDTNINLTSYLIANLIAQKGRPLNDGEFIKQALPECSKKLFQDMENHDKIKRIENVLLSRNTIKERIVDMSKNVGQQLIKHLNSCDFFFYSS